MSQELEYARDEFTKHPEPLPAVRKQWQARWRAWRNYSILLGSGGLGVLVSAFAGLDLEGLLLCFEMFVLPAWLLSSRDYLRARRHERRVSAIWESDPNWALQQLTMYHAAQLEREQEERALQKRFRTNMMLSLGGFVLTLSASIWVVNFMVVSGWVDGAWFVLVCSVVLFGILTVYYGSEKSKLKDRHKRFEAERRAFREASGDLPEDILHVGGLSVAVDEDQRQGALSEAES